MAFDAAPVRDRPLAEPALAQLFTEARTRNAWSDRPVPEDLLRRLYDLTKFGPTAVNNTPARFVFVTSPEAKARLDPLIDFHEHLPVLFPHAPGARDWFADEAARRESAFRNASLQGGYFMLAARALGLDVGPMSGFDAGGVKSEFFAGTAVEPNFIVNIGYGTDENLFPRSPRLAFADAATII